MERTYRQEILSCLKEMGNDVKQLGSEQAKLAAEQARMTEQIRLYTKDLSKLEESIDSLLKKNVETGKVLERHSLILKTLLWAGGVAGSVYFTHAAELFLFK